MSGAYRFRERPGIRHGGLAMVEFVVAVPVVLLVLFTTVEFSRFLIQYSTLNDAVRNAARYVAGNALNGTDGTLQTGSGWSTLASQGANLVVFGNVGGTGAAILPSLTTAQVTVTEDTTTNNISVAASYPYQGIFGSSVPNFFGGHISTVLTLNVTTVMRAI